jgi:hypothetical protein
MDLQDVLRTLLRNHGYQPAAEDIIYVGQDDHIICLAWGVDREITVQDDLDLSLTEFLEEIVSVAGGEFHG